MNTSDITSQFLIPLQYVATQYGYSALLDENDNEEPITEAMIHAACEEAADTLYWFMSDRSLQDRSFQDSTRPV